MNKKILNTDCIPHQVHLSLDKVSNDVVVMWLTHSHCDSVIKYGAGAFNLNMTGKGDSVELEKYRNNTLGFMHRVVMKV